MRNYSVSEINCLTITLETSLKPKCPYYTVRTWFFNQFTAAIMKRHCENTKHILKYLASESNKPCTYGECCSSQHSCLFFFFQVSYFLREKLLYELSSTGHYWPFFLLLFPKTLHCLSWSVGPNTWSMLLFQDFTTWIYITYYQSMSSLM